MTSSRRKEENGMRNLWTKRILTMLLICCLLPLGAMGEDAPEGPSPADAWPVDDSSVTRSRFTLNLSLDADAFPADGLTDFKGWQQFLEKLSLSGTADTQRFPRMFDRVYFEGGLNLKGKEVLPFTYEGYHSYRYLRSPALKNRSIHFQMNNFFEFMFKPYYYMGLPTNYLALLLYPEAASFLVESYEDPLADCLASTESRVIPYADLYELCEALDQIAADDPDYQHVWYYVTALLIDLQVSDSTYDSLCSWETLLDFLDPEQKGMTVEITGATETYVLGDTRVFTRTSGGNQRSFSLSLPNDEGYTLTLTGRMEDSAAGGENGEARLTVALGEDTRIDLRLEATGLPKDGDTQALGSVRLSAGGSALGDTDFVQSFVFRLTRSAAVPPYRVTFGLDWLHPETEKAALTALYKADIEMLDESALKDHEYDNQNDFFHLNEGFLEEYRQDFTLPLTLAFAPVVLEMSGGVINDILRFCDTTGILASLGIE